MYWSINIGKSSLSYWYNKSSELQTLRMKINPSAARRPFPWKLLAGSDVGGAIAGGVRAAVINLWPGAGQAAYGAAIVGSGVGASAGAVVPYMAKFAFKSYGFFNIKSLLIFPPFFSKNTS